MHPIQPLPVVYTFSQNVWIDSNDCTKTRVVKQFLGWRYRLPRFGETGLPSEFPVLTECQWETKPNERIWVVYVEGEFYGEVSPRKWVQLQRNSVEEKDVGTCA